MFFRALAFMIGSILLISILRSVIGAILQFLTGSAAGSGGARSGSYDPRNSQGPRPAGAKPKASEPLKKDPVCGTFVAPSTAVQVTDGKGVHYFCSASCRDKYAG